MSNKSTYKVLDLFGNEEIKFVEKNNSKPTLFDDYDGFLDKFEVKKNNRRLLHTTRSLSSCFGLRQ